MLRPVRVNTHEFHCGEMELTGCATERGDQGVAAALGREGTTTTGQRE